MPEEPDHVKTWLSEGARYTVAVRCATGQTEQECEAEFDELVAVALVLHPED